MVNCRALTTALKWRFKECDSYLGLQEQLQCWRRALGEKPGALATEVTRLAMDIQLLLMDSPGHLYLQPATTTTATPGPPHWPTVAGGGGEPGCGYRGRSPARGAPATSTGTPIHSAPSPAKTSPKPTRPPPPGFGTRRFAPGHVHTGPLVSWFPQWQCPAITTPRAYTAPLLPPLPARGSQQYSRGKGAPLPQKQLTAQHCPAQRRYYTVTGDLAPMQRGNCRAGQKRPRCCHLQRTDSPSHPKVKHQTCRKAMYLSQALDGLVLLDLSWEEMVNCRALTTALKWRFKECDSYLGLQEQLQCWRRALGEKPGALATEVTRLAMDIQLLLMDSPGRLYLQPATTATATPGPPHWPTVAGGAPAHQPGHQSTVHPAQQRRVRSQPGHPQADVLDFLRQ
ncbi:UNVERIFIED_CONTAM: hypothetical protein FKN15_018683 [Acipenser sinensis]